MFCYDWKWVAFIFTHTHIHPFNGPFNGTTQVSLYQKGKTNLDFTEAKESEWQWHQLGHMQVCTLLQTDNHASTPPLSFLQAECPSCCPTNSVKALKATFILHSSCNWCVNFVQLSLFIMNAHKVTAKFNEYHRDMFREQHAEMQCI